MRLMDIIGFRFARMTEFVDMTIKNDYIINYIININYNVCRDIRPLL